MIDLNKLVDNRLALRVDDGRFLVGVGDLLLGGLQTKTQSAKVDESGGKRADGGGRSSSSRSVDGGLLRLSNEAVLGDLSVLSTSSSFDERLLGKVSVLLLRRLEYNESV